MPVLYGCRRCSHSAKGCIAHVHDKHLPRRRMERMVHAMKANAVPLPRVTFVSSATEVDGEHVCWLASKCYTRPHQGPYSTSHAVTQSLQNSASVFAAFCRADALPLGICDDLPGRIHVDANDDAESTDMWQLRRSAKRQKVLVGLAHASSDGVFVGTVDHVMVLPQFQNQGLGRRLMNKVCSQLLQRDVTDIGTLVPPQHAHFFRLCGFSLDKYNSVAMALASDASVIDDACLPYANCDHHADMDMRQMCAAMKPSTDTLLQAYVTSCMYYNDSNSTH